MNVISKDQLGFTILELLVTMFIVSILMSGALLSFKSLQRPLSSGSELTVGFFRLARSTAISQTKSIVVFPSSSNVLKVKSGNTCVEARSGTTIEDDLLLELPYGVGFSSTSWDLCFSARGFIDNSVTITINDFEGKTSNITTFLGGTAKIS